MSINVFYKSISKMSHSVFNSVTCQTSISKLIKLYITDIKDKSINEKCHPEKLLVFHRPTVKSPAVCITRGLTCIADNSEFTCTVGFNKITNIPVSYQRPFYTNGM